MAFITIDPDSLKSELAEIDTQISKLEERRDQLEAVLGYFNGQVKRPRRGGKQAGVVSIKDCLREVFAQSAGFTLEMSYIIKQMAELRPGTSYAGVYNTLQAMVGKGELKKIDKNSYLSNVS